MTTDYLIVEDLIVEDSRPLRHAVASAPAGRARAICGANVSGCPVAAAPSVTCAECLVRIMTEELERCGHAKGGTAALTVRQADEIARRRRSRDLRGRWIDHKLVLLAADAAEGLAELADAEPDGPERGSSKPSRTARSARGD